MPIGTDSVASNPYGYTDPKSNEVGLTADRQKRDRAIAVFHDSAASQVLGLSVVRWALREVNRPSYDRSRCRSRSGTVRRQTVLRLAYGSQSA